MSGLINDREQEINSVMRLIDDMCKDARIGIGARDGEVIIKDQFTGKEYIMREESGGDETRTETAI